jgi:hypothetical protein
MMVIVVSASRRLGSAGCQPALVGSLPTSHQPSDLSNELFVLGKLPSTTGRLPVIPGMETRSILNAS